jgi:hypothetical protein
VLKEQNMDITHQTKKRDVYIMWALLIFWLVLAFFTFFCMIANEAVTGLDWPAYILAIGFFSSGSRFPATICSMPSGIGCTSPKISSSNGEFFTTRKSISPR